MSQDPAMRGKDVAIHLQDVTSPTVPLVIVQGGNDQKNGFCWLDTPIVRPAPATVSNVRVTLFAGNCYCPPPPNAVFCFYVFVSLCIYLMLPLEYIGVFKTCRTPVES